MNEGVSSDVVYETINKNAQPNYQLPHKRTDDVGRPRRAEQGGESGFPAVVAQPLADVIDALYGSDPDFTGDGTIQDYMDELRGPEEGKTP